MPYAVSRPGTPQYEGNRIGELARQCFPGGVLVDNKVFDHQGALDRTRNLMASGSTTIFEGAFEYGSRRTRVDILKRIGPERWALYEVKSATSIHDEHYHDAAFQADVLRKAGVALESVTIIHVDRAYRRGAAGIDTARFFRFADVTDRLRPQSGALDSNLTQMTTALDSGQAPKVAPGLHCHKPHDCEFYTQCTAPLPRDWIGNLPRVTQNQLDEMAAAGIASIADIPDRINLSSLQETVRHAHKTGVPFVAVDIAEILRPLSPPALYLDFESMMPGIPLYLDTAPYQHIPFLFSLHTDIGGKLSHADFIAPPGEDPRRGFAEALIHQTAATDCPIIVYSPYEKRILNELASALPDLAPSLQKIVARLQDLLVVVRRAVYLPAFNGSFSIKEVAPALASDVTYKDLAIANGTTAAAVYQRLVETPALPSAELAQSLSELRVYCERDTLATVRVHRALIAMTRKVGCGSV